MTISIPDELERLILDQVASGRFASAADVVSEGLRLIQERDGLEELRGEIQIGIDAVDRGEYDVYDDESLDRLFLEIEQRGSDRLAQRQSQDPRI